MGVARGQAEQAGENSGGPHTRCRQPGFRSGWIRRSTSICAGRRRTGRPSPGKRSSGKRISRATIKSCGLGFVSWKAVCTAVEASGGLARARIRRGARSGRALGDSSRGVGDMGEGGKCADLPEAQQSFFGRRIRLYSPGIVEIQSPVRSPNKAELSTAPSGESTRNPPARWPAVSGINSKRSLTSRAPGSSVKSASPTK